LFKLPDLKEIDERDEEALEDIACLALNTKYRAAFEAMLNEGIKDNKRKYCSPLEALLWIAYDKDFNQNKSIQNYYVESLMKEAWRYSATSAGYKSDRWGDFKEVVNRLNSPYLANLWALDNLVYDMSRLENVGDPETTFKLKRGICRHSGMFVTECLTRSGYSAWNFTVLYGEQVGKHAGHSVSTVRAENGLWIVWDSTRKGQIIGPFDNYDSLAKDIMTNGVRQAHRTILRTYLESNSELIRRNIQAYNTYDP